MSAVKCELYEILQLLDRSTAPALERRTALHRQAIAPWFYRPRTGDEAAGSTRPYFYKAIDRAESIYNLREILHFDSGHSRGLRRA
jgi:hypothetical protein